MAELEPWPGDGDWWTRRKWFEKLLEGLPREASILVAARATLRALSLLDRFLIDNIHSNEPRRTAQQSLLALLRCHLLSSAASLAPADERVRFAASDAAAAADDMDATADAAAAAAMFGPGSALVGPATIAYNAVAAASDDVAAASDAAATTAYSAAAAVAAAFADDCLWLGKSETAGSLVATPLWPSLQSEVRAAFEDHLPAKRLRGGEPEALRARWQGFEARLRSEGADFDVWADFYNAIRSGSQRGRYLFGLPTPRALKLLHDVALIENALWDDPPRLNARFKAMVAAAREEGVGGQKESIKPSDMDGEVGTSQSSSRGGNSKTGKTKSKKAAPDAARMAELLKEIDGYFEALDKRIEEEVDAAECELQKIVDPEERRHSPWRDASDRLDALRKLASNLREAVHLFAKGKETKPELEKKQNAFWQGVNGWWKADSRQVLNNASAYTIKGVTISAILGTASLFGYLAGDPESAFYAAAGMYTGKAIADGMGRRKKGKSKRK